jgi:hypothetical protein
MNQPEYHALEYVDAYLHDALSQHEKEQVAAHCEACPICRTALEEARRRQEAMQALPPVEAPETLVQATLARIARNRVTRRRWTTWGLLAAAAAAIVLAATNLYYYNLAPAPYDLRVLGQADLVAGSEASLRVLLLDPRDAAPLSGVPVQIDLIEEPGNAVRLASFTTDQFGSGAVRMQLPDWAPGKYQLRVSAQPGRQTESIERTVTLHRSWQLMLTSDKPVYQPGETIHVRSLALSRPQTKPVAGQEAVFSVTDPKGNMIFRERDVTSRFGICATDCPLAGEILEGPYQLCCELGDTKSTITVDVKKYVLPKFKIAVELDEPYYQPGQKVRGTLSARYFFGKPVENGEVEVDVQAGEIGPAGRSLLPGGTDHVQVSGGEIGANAPHPSPLPEGEGNQKLPSPSGRGAGGEGGDPLKIAHTLVRTDSSGMARFEFVLPPSLVGRSQDSGDARFTLTATVRDSAGQKQSATASRVVTEQPIRIEVIPESGTLVRGLPNTIYFLATYADGRPVPAWIAVSGFAQEIHANDMGAASIEFTPQADSVHWTVAATDESGRRGRREVTLECGSPAERFLVRTDKAVYDGGQTVHVVALGGGSEPLFLDLIKDGQTMLTDVVPMAKGRGEYQIDLPPELSGTLQLCAYRYGRDGLPVMQTRVIYVRQAGGLKVEARLDRPEYRPGEQAKLTFSLSDTQGKPVAGALGLAAVDEAVYSVVGPTPGMQSIFSSLEQEILKPVYAIYDWSPEMQVKLPADERDRFEKAVFAPLPKDQRPVYSLRESTYPEEVRHVELVRNERLGQFTTIWAGLIGATVLVGLIRWVGWAWAALIVFLGFLFVGLVGLVWILGLVSSEDMAAPGKASAKGTAERKEPPQATQSSIAPARVREWFPETLLWRPELITDDNGRASLTVDLADSITTWRLSASAVSAEGRLGGTDASIRVFQPFFVDLNLPVALTRGDEVAVPAVVYNYLDKPLSVEFRLDEAPWFERLDPPAQELYLAAGEVRSVSYRLRVKQVGRHDLAVQASGGGVADAIKRTIEVVPDGRRVEQSASGTLQQPAQVAWSVPADAIEGSVKANVKLFPSTFSQLVDGLEAIFQRPYGCFEQTSSTTYPNVLALDYLRRSKKSVPQVEATARQYIHLGYQRLLGFEIGGGGFDWFGNPPANRTLTAYGLMEFNDMARVHDVDPKVIQRTRTWLLGQQDPDGSWAPEGHRFYHEDPTGRREDLERLSTTAYIAWSVFAQDARPASENRQGLGAQDSPLPPGEGQGVGAAQGLKAAGYLLRHEPAAIDDPYVLALVANALLAIRPGDAGARPYLDRLEAMGRRSTDEKLAWWEGVGRRTTFYGAGPSGNVETTALATLAMIEGRASPATIRAALAWLVQQKDASGAWRSTQATVLALKALLAGTDRPLGEARQRQIDITLDGQTVQTIVIPADQGEVLRQVDLSAQVAGGSHRLGIADRTGTATGYQATLIYHLPGAERPGGVGPLSIELVYDKTTLVVDDRVRAKATVTNRTADAAPMVIVDLPVPAGFAVDLDDLEALRSSGKIAKYQATPRSAIVYLRSLAPAEPLELVYHLRATMPVKITAPPARVYEYYDPDCKAESAPIAMAVAAK